MSSSLYSPSNSFFHVSATIVSCHPIPQLHIASEIKQLQNFKAILLKFHILKAIKIKTKDVTAPHGLNIFNSRHFA